MDSSRKTERLILRFIRNSVPIVWGAILRSHGSGAHGRRKETADPAAKCGAARFCLLVRENVLWMLLMLMLMLMLLTGANKVIKC